MGKDFDAPTAAAIAKSGNVRMSIRERKRLSAGDTPSLRITFSCYHVLAPVTEFTCCELMMRLLLLSLLALVQLSYAGIISSCFGFECEEPKCNPVKLEKKLQLIKSNSDTISYLDKTGQRFGLSCVLELVSFLSHENRIISLLLDEYLFSKLIQALRLNDFDHVSQLLAFENHQYNFGLSERFPDALFRMALASHPDTFYLVLKDHRFAYRIVNFIDPMDRALSRMDMDKIWLDSHSSLELTNLSRKGRFRVQGYNGQTIYVIGSPAVFNHIDIQRNLQDAFDKVKDRVGQLILDLNERGQDARLFRDYFGVGDKAVDTVFQNLMTLAAFRKPLMIVLEEFIEPDAQHQHDIFGFVTRARDRPLYIGLKLGIVEWSSPLLFHALVHELTHYVFDAQDYAYAQDCKRLATDFPEQALQNADSYARFIDGEDQSRYNDEMRLEIH